MPTRSATHHSSHPTQSIRTRFDADGQWAEPVNLWGQESDDPFEAVMWAPILKAALEELAPRQRVVVILRDVEGLSSEEVCDTLAISPGNQRILLHRGRSRLREILAADLRND